MQKSLSESYRNINYISKKQLLRNKKANVLVKRRGVNVLQKRLSQVTLPVSRRIILKSSAPLLERIKADENMYFISNSCLDQKDM